MDAHKCVDSNSGEIMKGFRSVLFLVFITVFAWVIIDPQAWFVLGQSTNEYGWTRLPTDAEIEQAANDIISFYSAKHGDSNDYSYSEVTDVRIVKMHKIGRAHV